MRRNATAWRWRGAIGLLAATAGAALMGAGPAAAAPSASDQTADFAVQVAASAHPAHQQASGTLPTPASGGKSLEAVTATSGFLFDALGDNEGLAPDLAQMFAFSSDDGRYTVGIKLTDNLLVNGDFVATYVNTDGNRATGSAAFGGADVAVGILGQIGPDVVGASRWNGTSFQAASFPSLISFASGSTDEVWSISAAELGVGPGTPTTAYFGTLYSGIYDDYYDFAPEPGGAPLAFTVGALAAPPAPVFTPTAPVSLPTVATGALTGPVGVRSLGLSSSSSGLKLRLGWVKGEGRVNWTVTLHARVNGRIRTREAYGVGAPGTRNVLRLIRLPASWRGKRVSIRLQVDDDAHTIVRSRTVVYQASTRATARPARRPPRPRRRGGRGRRRRAPAGAGRHAVGRRRGARG